MEKETWVGIAWAVGLFAAMGGVFAYEAATFELDDFHVAYNETVMEAEFGKNLAPGGSASETVLVDGTNLTFFEIHLTWADVGDSFSVEIRNATNAVVYSSGAKTGGSISHKVSYAAVPAGFHAAGVSLDDALGDHPDALVANTTQGGLGNWTIKVTLNSVTPVSAGGPVVGPTDCAFPTNDNCDTGEAFELHYSVGNYHVVFGEEAEAVMDANGDDDHHD